MSFDYNVPRTESSFDRRQRQILNGEVPESSITFDDADTLNKVVKKAAMSNLEMHAEATRKADSYSWQVANPQFIRSAENVKVINQLLQTWGITNPTYPDFQRAYEFALNADLLDIDKAEIAKQQDFPLQTFVGTLTKRTFDNIDEMIASERLAAIQQVPHPSEEEIALEDMPLDEFQTTLKQLERGEQQKGKGLTTGSNGDAWLTLHPEFIDSERNAKLMRQQLATMGVLEDVASIANYETAYKQLFPSGLLSLNKQSIAKQHREELQQRASEAVSVGGSIFDKTSEDEMYSLDVEELKKRANEALGRR
jgi:hypothetical protein